MVNILRLIMDDGNISRERLVNKNGLEHLWYSLAEKKKITNNKTIYIIRALYFPGTEDLSSQQSAFVSPTKAFQGHVYNNAYDKKLSVIDAHTHPFQSGVPGFSGIDLNAGRKNAEFMADHMPDEVEFGMIVFNQDCSAYSGLIYNKDTEDFQPINSIELIKSPLEVMHNDTI